MKRRDAIKTAIGSVLAALGVLAAPLMAKVATGLETVYFRGKPLVWVPNMGEGDLNYNFSPTQIRQMVEAVKLRRREAEQELCDQVEKSIGLVCGPLP